MYGQIIKILRKRIGMTQQELAKSIGFKSASAIGMVEREERQVDFDMLVKIANFFNVSTDFLLEKTEVAECPVCSLIYAPLIEEDYNEHELFHNKICEFKNSNLYINFRNRDRVKKDSIIIINSKTSTIGEKYDASIEYMKCYFSQNLEQLNSEPIYFFDEYISKLLNYDFVKDIFTKEVYSMLVDKYGIDKTFLNDISINETESAQSNINESLTENEIILLSKFNRLNLIGKQEAIKRVDELTEILKYTIDEDKTYLMPVAAHDKDGTFSDIDKKHDDDIMNDDSLWLK